MMKTERYILLGTLILIGLACARSIELGFTDHNLIAIKSKTKLPKAPSLIIHKRAFKRFNEASFIDEVKHVNWETVCLEEDPEAALSTFMRLFLQIADKHAPVRKTTVALTMAPPG